ADGVQGRVRSRAPAPEERSGHPAGRRVPRWRRGPLPAPPAAAARDGIRPQAEARQALVRYRVPGAGGLAPPARYGARSVRSAEAPPRRAGADRRVPYAHREGADRALARELRASREACEPT